MQKQCFCIALRRSSRRLTEIYDKALEPVGITISQFSQLRSISRYQPVSLTDLGRHLALDRSTVGRNTKVLERMGLVVACEGEDQRENAVALSEAGMELLARATPLWEKSQAALEDKLGPEAFERLAELLDTL